MKNSKSIINDGNKFHWLTLSGSRSRTALYDTVVEETRNFAVVPTKGSIVPGWMLIVPKFPTPRMADVPQYMKCELNDLVSRTSQRLENKFGSTFLFEHGGLKGSQVSCGVDQAHLHIVPLAFDIVSAAKSESNGEWISVGSARLPNQDFGDGEYWFVSSQDAAFRKTIAHPSSQFFRKIIARESGHADFWDYRSKDFVENVELTLKAMSSNG